jgi:hypothetical protein
VAMTYDDLDTLSLWGNDHVCLTGRRRGQNKLALPGVLGQVDRPVRLLTCLGSARTRGLRRVGRGRVICWCWRRRRRRGGPLC